MIKLSIAWGKRLRNSSVKISCHVRPTMTASRDSRLIRCQLRIFRGAAACAREGGVELATTVLGSGALMIDGLGAKLVACCTHGWFTLGWTRDLTSHFWEESHRRNLKKVLLVFCSGEVATCTCMRIFTTSTKMVEEAKLIAVRIRAIDSWMDVIHLVIDRAQRESCSGNCFVIDRGFLFVRKPPCSFFLCQNQMKNVLWITLFRVVCSLHLLSKFVIVAKFLFALRYSNALDSLLLLVSRLSFFWVAQRSRLLQVEGHRHFCLLFFLFCMPNCMVWFMWWRKQCACLMFALFPVSPLEIQSVVWKLWWKMVRSDLGVALVDTAELCQLLCPIC